MRERGRCRAQSHGKMPRGGRKPIWARSPCHGDSLGHRFVPLMGKIKLTHLGRLLAPIGLGVTFVTLTLPLPAAALSKVTRGSLAHLGQVSVSRWLIRPSIRAFDGQNQVTSFKATFGTYRSRSDVFCVNGAVAGPSRMG